MRFCGLFRLYRMYIFYNFIYFLHMYIFLYCSVRTGEPAAITFGIEQKQQATGDFKVPVNR